MCVVDAIALLYKIFCFLVAIDWVFFLCYREKDEITEKRSFRPFNIVIKLLRSDYNCVRTWNSNLSLVGGPLI